MGKISRSLILITALGISPIGQATLIVSDSANSTEQLGAFEANFTWTGSALEMAITNTSDAANSGALTGFLMNLPDGLSFNTALTDSKLFPLLPHSGPFDGSPYGMFDYGFAIGGHFLGGGPPYNGLGVGETGNFVFSDWTGLPIEFDTMTSEEIEHFLLDNTSTSKLGDANLLARFRGFNDGGSDKVPGIFDDIPPPPPPPPPPPAIEIPTPGTLVFMLTGLLGLVFRKKWRK
jgi:hypothetical protein